MSDGLMALLIGTGLNLAVALIIVRLIYYPSTHDRAYVFCFLAFNTVIFFVLALLSRTELSMGVGFGLFAIFSVLRYRTDEMPIREMTYLFVLIALPVINSVMLSGKHRDEVLFANAAVITTLFVLERSWGFRFRGRKAIMYERMDLIQPARREELVADLRQRTGLSVYRVDVGRLDYLRDTAELTIYYDEEKVTKPAATPLHPAVVALKSDAALTPATADAPRA